MSGRAALWAPGDLDKLHKALVAEHAALFAYGLLGARTSGALRTRVVDAFESHRARRDQLRSYIVAKGGKPAEADASYALPFFPSDARRAAELAVHLENGVTAAYLELVAAQDVSLRRYAAQAMQDAVLRAYRFRPAQPPAFPGMPAPAPAPTSAATASPSGAGGGLTE
ncbi:ferritin-like domain-containing protein [Nonomuraea maritima]|uniref:ferritin-like domain-containing protein n=1 Tax=Nonomuraea maritima TaxID=683260 RepID=UPI0037106C72